MERILVDGFEVWPMIWALTGFFLVVVRLEVYSEMVYSGHTRIAD